MAPKGLRVACGITRLGRGLGPRAERQFLKITIKANFLHVTLPVLEYNHTFSRHVDRDVVAGDEV
jgi:hypothetical protein